MTAERGDTAATAGAMEGFMPLPYRLRWQPRGPRPGAHPAAGDGGEGLFRRLVSLIDHPDPRRIDVRASLSDPFEAVHVRAFAPRRSVPVTALVDVSASMGFGAPLEVARLAATLAASAEASGDEFGLAAANAAVREDLVLPPSRRRGTAHQVFAALAAAVPSGRGATGLKDAVDRLPRRRGLVFLISDFLMPPADIAGILDALWRHDVVPVVVRDSRMEGDLPAYGLIEARDLETGGRRLILMRPALRARWQEAARRRLASLDQMFALRGHRAFHMVDRFDPDALCDHLANR